MDNELKELVQENIKLTQSNREILDKILWHQRWAQILSFLKWVVIVGSAVGILYYLEPVYKQLWNTYTSMIDTIGTVNVENR